MSSPLLVVGSVAFDCVETRAGRRDEILGGAATFISLAASNFCPVNLVGVVGRDDFPEEHVRLLTSRGIDVDGLERVEGRTFRWSGVYAEDFSSRTTLDTQLGVFEHFAPKIPPKYSDARFLMLGNINPGLQLEVLGAVPKDCFVALDTMNLWIDIARRDLDAVISRIDLLIINDEESRMLTGEPQIAVAAERILTTGPSAVIIKRGEHGAWLFAGHEVFFAAAFPLRSVVDPTGAGDTFAGGLMGYIAGTGRADISSIKRGMVYGTAAASATCEGFGVERLAATDRASIETRFDMLTRLVSVG